MGIPPQKPFGRIVLLDEIHSARRPLHAALYEQGFDVNDAFSRQEAISLVHAVRYDAILIDIAPVRTGVGICQELRFLFPGLVILILSVRGDQEDCVHALDGGADDYIVKPIHVRELTARILAAVRRYRSATEGAGDAIRIGDITIYAKRRIVRKAGQNVHLTPKEFDLLLYLVMHRGKSVPHGRLLATVWGPESVREVHYLRTFVRQLRKKLEDDTTTPNYLLTDSHIGYRFIDHIPRFSGAGAE